MDNSSLTDDICPPCNTEFTTVSDIQVMTRPLSQGKTECDTVSEMSDMTRLLSQGNEQGCIDGMLHIAALTCGDGTCGLHALFGVCSSSQMYAPGIRNLLVSELAGELLPMMQSLSCDSSKVLLTEV